MELAEDSIRFVVAQYARLAASYADALERPDLIEPNARFFPDEFRLDAPSVARLFQRIMGYAPIAADLGVALAFVEDETDEGGSCGSGACGTGAKIRARDGVVELEDGYRVEVKIGDVGNPVILTTSLARSVGALVLAEAGEDIETSDIGALSEISATVCGFGALLLAGSAVYAKGCGGLRMQQATTLSVHELALAVALFVRANDVKPGTARAHLEVTQREAFDDALRLVDSNPDVVATLKRSPADLADGLFTLSPPRGLLGRLFAKKSDDDLAFVPPPRSAPARTRTAEEERRLAETRALVEDALKG